MTDLDSLLAAGLSQEEAEYILSRRAVKAQPGGSLSQDIDDVSKTMDRLSIARSRLAQAQKKTGVQPVEVDGEELVKGHDPDADVGVHRFYEGKGGVKSTHLKPDPDGWEDPP